MGAKRCTGETHATVVRMCQGGDVTIINWGKGSSGPSGIQQLHLDALQFSRIPATAGSVTMIGKWKAASQHPKYIALDYGVPGCTSHKQEGNKQFAHATVCALTGLVYAVVGSTDNWQGTIDVAQIQLKECAK